MQSIAQVSVIRVSDYEPDRVLDGLRNCLKPFGGLSKFVQPGNRVLIKPNILGGFHPERAVTTHPSLIRAIIILVKELGGIPLIGDSPAIGTLEDALELSGIYEILEETGAQFIDFSEPYTYENSSNKLLKKITLSSALRSIDKVITVPKLKTHAQMAFTGALKNQFGFVPGSLKSQWHFRLKDPDWLAALILDINRIVKPVLTIMDGIIAMDGPGPSSGNPKQLGLILAGDDPVAVDVIACKIIDLNWRYVPLLRVAHEQKFGATGLDKIQLHGGNLNDFIVHDFQNVNQLVDVLRLAPLPTSVFNILRNTWVAKPRINEKLCSHCNRCKNTCPVTPPAIDPALAPHSQVDDSRCIRCYCCHEVCPEKAIYLKEHWLGAKLPLSTISDLGSRLISFLKNLKQHKVS